MGAGTAKWIQRLGYELRNQGSTAVGGKRFISSSGTFIATERLGREAHHSSQSSSEVKNWCKYTSVSPYTFRECTRDF